MHLESTRVTTKTLLLHKVFMQSNSGRHKSEKRKKPRTLINSFFLPPPTLIPVFAYSRITHLQNSMLGDFRGGCLRLAVAT